ncbi:TspO/MBR family protein [Sphingorhabdus sp. EL138]|uniref:TspO/MBR family protein n=1 Tax=Sphingorhabdus sp. EL138 TaxID=2073156 RepID=UPI0025D77387|nr:TspO/MBR family protein [Sphingorhabdus sp. EL138]
MNQFVPPTQSRMSLARWALFVIPTIMFLGFLSGTMSGSTADNAWYQTLLKPDIQPPGWVFGVVWPTLYLMMGLALAMVLNARGTRDRNKAILLFVSQFLINLTWSPIFFGAHQVTAAFFIILVMLGIAIATTFAFARVRKAAAWLMVPYLVWISFAAILNFQIDQLNPDAESLYVPAVTSQIG